MEYPTIAPFFSATKNVSGKSTPDCLIKTAGLHSRGLSARSKSQRAAKSLSAYCLMVQSIPYSIPRIPAKKSVPRRRCAGRKAGCQQGQPYLFQIPN
ncbi:hypothetical protein ASZ90_009578 [hydrocarbon metagenome]|uniref:Uncharacterized protein n=1 Tax=hydrocarbon metagenome TaxID=938273 RepID=A0A0W8FIJ8_9ZZZZ